MQFIEIDKIQFVEQKIDITDMISEEELIEKINSEHYEENKYFKLIFIGNKKFEINTNKILKNISHENIIKLKDKTKLEINLENIANQNNLKGIFVKNLLNKIQENPNEKNKILKAIEIGLSSF